MELEIMFKDIMALAERKKMPLKSPQVVVDCLVGSFFEDVSSFWLYVEKVGDASWSSHKEAVRHAWTRWATKFERTITLIQTKANICIKNLQTYKVKYDKISQLKKLSKITSEQLFKTWLNRKNPITGLEID